MTDSSYRESFSTFIATAGMRAALQAYNDGRWVRVVGREGAERSVGRSHDVWKESSLINWEGQIALRTTTREPRIIWAVRERVCVVVCEHGKCYRQHHNREANSNFLLFFLVQTLSTRLSTSSTIFLSSFAPRPETIHTEEELGFLSSSCHRDGVRYTD